MRVTSKIYDQKYRKWCSETSQGMDLLYFNLKL